MTICDNSSHEIVQQEKCRLYTTATVASWDLFPLRPYACTAIGTAFFTVYYSAIGIRTLFFILTSRWYLITIWIKTQSHGLSHGDITLVRTSNPNRHIPGVAIGLLKY